MRVVLGSWILFLVAFPLLSKTFKFDDNTVIEVTGRNQFTITQKYQETKHELRSLSLAQIDKVSAKEWTYLKLNDGEAACEQIFDTTVKIYVTSGSCRIQKGLEQLDLKENNMITIRAHEHFSVFNESSEPLRIFIQNIKK